jgi:hypothetical protein
LFCGRFGPKESERRSRILWNWCWIVEFVRRVDVSFCARLLGLFLSTVKDINAAIRGAESLFETTNGGAVEALSEFYMVQKHTEILREC